MSSKGGFRKVPVARIKIEVELEDGRGITFEFIRPEKIADLLRDEGKVGSFFREAALLADKS